MGDTFRYQIALKSAWKEILSTFKNYLKSFDTIVTKDRYSAALNPKISA